uniref:MSP domain-containing protein n=1 Tax=Setaria digitata TaxID=48799 RepID=A0A915Q7K6_9BILA
MAAVEVASGLDEETNVNTALGTYHLSVAKGKTKPNYEILPVGRENTTIKFKRERNNDGLGRVLLRLRNNSQNLIKWKLRCTTTKITAFPSSNGQITPFDEEKCLLTWICPDSLNTWAQMKPPKLLVSLSLVSDSGEIIGSADVILLTQLDMSGFCAEENLPVHNLIFGSEKSKLNHNQSELFLKTAVDVTEMTPRTINFALDRFQNDVAYVQLNLINSGKREIIWKLMTNNKYITASPSGSGLILAHQTGKCLLSWHLPKHWYTWDKIAPAKLLLLVQIHAGMGKLLDERTAKYIVFPKTDQTCTTDSMPIHQIILVSAKEYASKAKPTMETTMSTERIASEANFTTSKSIGSAIQISGAQFANDEIVWKIGVICSVTVLSYLILKMLLEYDSLI